MCRVEWLELVSIPFFCLQFRLIASSLFSQSVSTQDRMETDAGELSFIVMFHD